MAQLIRVLPTPDLTSLAVGNSVAGPDGDVDIPKRSIASAGKTKSVEDIEWRPFPSKSTVETLAIWIHWARCTVGKSIECLACAYHFQIIGSRCICRSLHRCRK